MAWDGYLEVSGTEIINVERTEAYVAAVGEGVGLRPVFGSDRIHVAIGDEPYRSPLIDDAPWVNESNPDTSDFYGLYPIEITGLDDSTMSAPVTEHIDAGASIGTARDGSRAIRVHGLLVGATRMGVEAGLAWLSEALRTDSCSLDAGCGGGDVAYFKDEPCVDDTLYSASESSTSLSDSFGTVPAPGLIDFRWDSTIVPFTMPSHCIWNFGSSEGTAFVYGRMDHATTDILDSSEVISPHRVNYALEPGLNAAGANWVNGTWNSGVGENYYTANPIDPSDPLGASAPTISVPTLPLAATGYTLSLELRGQDPTASYAVSVVDASGATVGSASFGYSPDWSRVSLPLSITTAGAALVTVSSSSPFDATRVLVELGALTLPYFDGVIGPAGYAVSWDGTPSASTATALWGGIAETYSDDSHYRPFIQALQGQLSNLQLTTFLRVPVSLTSQLDAYQATLHEVGCTQGPQIIQRIYRDAGAFLEIDFILVAGDPYAYSTGTSVNTYPLASAAFEDPIEDLLVVDDSWLQDPASLAITPPVSAPTILDPSLRSYSSWQRYYVAIPASTVQDWGVSVPTIGLTSKAEAIKQVRIRFHPNPFSYSPTQVDATNYCSEVVVSYMPAAARMVIDGITQSAVASKGSQATLPADHLLYGSDGSPITWPELSCGIPYLMTIDVPDADTYDLFDVDLVMRRRS